MVILWQQYSKHHALNQVVRGTKYSFICLHLQTRLKLETQFSKELNAFQHIYPVASHLTASPSPSRKYGKVSLLVGSILHALHSLKICGLLMTDFSTSPISFFY